jgi:LemA protein
MWVFLIILVVIVGGGILIYNGLVQMREHVDAAWSDIDVQLKRRHDLVPNLVETVKGYASHERRDARGGHPGA